jgi:hypothetical protein
MATKTKIKLKATKKDKSYWDNNGAYQKEYTLLWDKLVPSTGEADTVHGEMLRAISRLTYDYCNNGNCNAVDDVTDECPECNGTGYETINEWEEDEEEVDCSYCDGDCRVTTGKEVTPYYKQMLEFLEEHLKEPKLVAELEAFMTGSRGYSTYKFDDTEMGFYNRVCDAVMYQILTTKNESRKIKA